MAGSAKKQLAVFVHGFGSSPACWEPLLQQLRSDASLAASFDFACYQYSTSWLNFSFLRRIPRLEEVSSGLAEFLEESRFADVADITLVGHSQGGLVIQSYLAEKLKAGQGEDLARIRQVVLIATPNLGSTMLQPARKFLFAFFANPQERALRVLNPSIRDLMVVMLDRVVNAKAREKTCWPIPVRCFWGEDDAVVPEASGRGPYSEGAALPGDHFSILRPETRDDARLRAISEALREPVGHKNFFEVDQYEVAIAVQPLPEDHAEEVSFGGPPSKTRTIRSDNLAHVQRAVLFSRRNRCTDLFEIRYRTRNDGFIRPAISHVNEAPAAELGRYDDYGTEFIFQFTPKPGETYKAVLDVYKGFDDGHRDLHFHLGKQTHYRRYRLRLDLSSYLAAGYQIKMNPQLHFFGQDTGTCELCAKRVLDNPLDYARSDPAGIWEWNLGDIREGVIDARWDLTSPAPLGAMSAGQGP